MLYSRTKMGVLEHLCIPPAQPETQMLISLVKMFRTRIDEYRNGSNKRPAAFSCPSLIRAQVNLKKFNKCLLHLSAHLKKCPGKKQKKLKSTHGTYSSHYSN